MEIKGSHVIIVSQRQAVTDLILEGAPGSDETGGRRRG